MNKKFSLTAVALVLSLVFAACGGGGSSGTTPASTTTSAGGGGARGATSTLNVEADATQLAYTKQHLSTPQGSVTINFKNLSSTPHNVKIEGANGRINKVGATDTISKGSTSTKLSLVPGTYTFYCSVDGHRAAGMEGTLSVTETGA